MKNSPKLISNYEYKKFFLPDITTHNLFNNSNIQLYRIENYLKKIVIPVNPYQTTFNFLIFVTQGYVKQQLETSVFEINANQALSIKQGNFTATLELSDDVEGFFVIYENEVITEIALTTSDLRFFYTSPFSILDHDQINWLIRLFELLEEELNQTEHINAISTALLQSALLKIIRTENTDNKSLSRASFISFQFRELVQKNHIQHKNIDYYSNILKISDNYLNKCVKETTGKAPKQWINEITIQHSQILLQDNSKEIAEIAFELHFQSPSYFSRMFKKVTGESPSDYRTRFLKH
ncbi:MAG: helix-turn-helix domain-containing protein [Flavobacterium nitrogenifigens]|uniref:AraC-type DNA-binding protein n=1 Tax=Flavobacterium nitrogenifigens TaxID=1617283 RepID=A0A521FFE2_9FLAO|nr:helix-turn-helix domain-containing protein [Flavobacterium nitrogenifigens]KAF2338953.1 AraC family transcriptional regulator [Flavobacterium nitrogenifigens]MDQ8014905.1 helix-turn-helix domain-containing protein [Flavobacterium nitrogenifigens]SMO94902.1 AraC-type DNA-binding protein [Flavobacterium nitrogenifigens]